MSDALDQEIRTLRAQFWSARDPEGRAFVPLADAYRRKGELAEAASLVEDGLVRLPEFTPGHLIAARIHRAQGDLDRARGALDRVLALDGENILALLERAEVARDTGDPEGAVEGLRRLLSLDPNHMGARAALDRMVAAAEGTGVGAVAVADEPDEALEGHGSTATADLDAGASVLPPEEADSPFTAEELLDPDDLFLGEEASADAELVDPEDLFLGEEASADTPETPPGADEPLDRIADLDLDFAEDDDEGWDYESIMSAGEEPPAGEDVPAREETLAEEDVPAREEPPAEEEAPESITATGDLDVFDFEFLVEGSAAGDPEPAAPVGESDVLEPGPRDDGIEPEEPFVDFARTEPVAEPVEPGTLEPERLVEEEGVGAADDPEVAEGDLAAAEGERSPLVTRTMAEIFVRQGLTEQAVEIYRRLSDEDPDRPELRERLAELEASWASERPAAPPGASTAPAGRPVGDDEDAAMAAPQWTAERDADEEPALATPFAWSEGDDGEVSEEETRTIRDHFSDLLSWVPGAVPVGDLAPEAFHEGEAAPGGTAVVAEPEAPVLEPAPPAEEPTPPAEEPAPPAEEPALTAVPIEELAPPPVPIESLAPGAPAETAPPGSPAAEHTDRAASSGPPEQVDEDLAEFQAWLESLGR